MLKTVSDECRIRNIELLIVTDSKYLKKIYSEQGYKVEHLSTDYFSEGNLPSKNSYLCEKKYYPSPDWLLSRRSRSLFKKSKNILLDFSPDVVIQRPGGEILRRAFYASASALGIESRTFGEDVFSAGGLIYSGEFKKLIKAANQINITKLTDGLENIAVNKNTVIKYDSPIRIKDNKINKLRKMLLSKDAYVIWTYFSSVFKNSIISRARSLLANAFIYKKIKNDEQYYFFPLNVDAESELYVRNPFLANQYLLCKSILSFIPSGFNLVVKEHPGLQKSLSFYEMLKLRISGVTIVKSTLSGRSVARGAVGVIINSSTVGLEAIAMQKPLLWLGMWPFADIIEQTNENLSARATKFFETPEKFIVDKDVFLRSLNPYVWNGSFYKSEHSFKIIIGGILDENHHLKNSASSRSE